MSGHAMKRALPVAAVVLAALASAANVFAHVQLDPAPGPSAAICNATATWDRNSPVTLDGSCSSDPGGAPLTYEWDLDYDGVAFSPTTDGLGLPVVGRIVTKADGFSTYTADANGNPNGVTHAVCVRVRNPAGASSTACINVVVKPPPHCPVPSAGGPYFGAVGVPVQVDASHSFDVDADPLTYAWDFDNDGQFSDGVGASPTATFAVPGVYTVAVRVTDNPSFNPVQPYNAPQCSVTAFATVEIGNHPPVADAGGPYSGAPGQTIALNGSASSDPDGDAIAFAWDLSANGLYSDSSSPSPSFSIPAAAAPGTTFSVCLRVSDPIGRTSTSCATVSVVQSNRPPTAIVTRPVIVTDGPFPLSVGLDASRSSDPDGDQLAFRWTGDAGLVFDNASSATPSVTVAAYGTYVAHVAVSDGALTTGADVMIDVVDGTAPSFNVKPSNIVIEADASTAAAIAAWLGSVTAFDPGNPGEVVTVANDFSPGAGIGGVGVGNPTLVTWTATDSRGNAAQIQATVTVVDTKPPVLQTPAITVEAASPAGSVVAYSGVQAVDYVSGTVAVSCTPASGSTFAVGATSVSCQGTDAAGNTGTSSFIVTVTDTTPPVLDLPADITVHATTAAGAPVAYSASATDLVAGAVGATCDPASGVTFPVGATTVHCSATDGSGNTSHGSFVVNVLRDTTPPEVTPTVAGTLGANGWYTGNAAVSWSVLDPESSYSATGCDDANVAVDTGGVTFTCSATSAGGTTTRSATVKRDATPPDVTFTGNLGSYGVDQVVAIACHAADATSGVAASACTGVSGPAWTFGTGLVSRTVSVQDRAGNTGAGTVTFTVVAPTSNTLCRLTMQFIQSSSRYQALSPAQAGAVTLLGTSLCQTLEQIVPRMSASQKRSLIRAYDAGVDGLVKLGWVTPGQAATLEALADQL